MGPARLYTWAQETTQSTRSPGGRTEQSLLSRERQAGAPLPVPLDAASSRPGTRGRDPGRDRP